MRALRNWERLSICIQSYITQLGCTGFPKTAQQFHLGESKPYHTTGAATPQPPPGPDTRWTTLAQLIPGIAQTSAALGRASSGMLAGGSAPVLMEVCCQT